MNLEINQGNIHLILPGKTSRMAQIYAEKYSVSIIEALRHVYNSKVYTELEKEDSKLWHLGPVDLFNDMIKEE